MEQELFLHNAVWDFAKLLRYQLACGVLLPAGPLRDIRVILVASEVLDDANKAAPLGSTGREVPNDLLAAEDHGQAAAILMLGGERSAGSAVSSAAQGGDASEAEVQIVGEVADNDFDPLRLRFLAIGSSLAGETALAGEKVLDTWSSAPASEVGWRPNRLVLYRPRTARRGLVGRIRAERRKREAPAALLVFSFGRDPLETPDLVPVSGFKNS